MNEGDTLSPSTHTSGFALRIIHVHSIFLAPKSEVFGSKSIGTYTTISFGSAVFHADPL